MERSAWTKRFLETVGVGSHNSRGLERASVQGVALHFSIKLTVQANFALFTSYIVLMEGNFFRVPPKVKFLSYFCEIFFKISLKSPNFPIISCEILENFLDTPVTTHFFPKCFPLLTNGRKYQKI